MQCITMRQMSDGGQVRACDGCGWRVSLSLLAAESYAVSYGAVHAVRHLPHDAVRSGHIGLQGQSLAAWDS